MPHGSLSKLHVDKPPPAPWIKSPRLSRLTFPCTKVNDGTEDGGPESPQWSWGRRQSRRMMIDCMESGLSWWIRPLLPKEHHLLSVRVTHSTALTRACKGPRWEHIRPPSGAPMTGWIWKREGGEEAVEGRHCGKGGGGCISSLHRQTFFFSNNKR